jgi:hypothetical protein
MIKQSQQIQEMDIQLEGKKVGDSHREGLRFALAELKSQCEAKQSRVFQLEEMLYTKEWALAIAEDLQRRVEELKREIDTSRPRLRDLENRLDKEKKNRKQGRSSPS